MTRRHMHGFSDLRWSRDMSAGTRPHLTNIFDLTPPFMRQKYNSELERRRLFYSSRQKNERNTRYADRSIIQIPGLTPLNYISALGTCTINELSEQLETNASENNIEFLLLKHSPGR